MTEAAFLKLVIDLAHLHGWRCAHFRPARTAHGWRTAVQADGKGWPDLFLVRGERAVVMELKVGRNKLTEAQASWLGHLHRAGIEAYVCRECDWKLIESVLR